MKRFTLIAVMILCIVSLASAQTPATLISKSYAVNQIDTNKTNSGIATAFGHITALITAADSFDCKIYLDYSTDHGTTWTNSDSLSINSLTKVHYEWVLRDNVTEKIPGLQSLIQFRPNFAATRNTLIAKKYSIRLLYTK